MSAVVKAGASAVVRLGLILMVLVLLVAGVFAFGPSALRSGMSDFFSSLNPFHEERKDRTGPSVLVSLKDLNEYKAASGYYETVVDIDDDSALPSFVKGERVLHVGKGTVGAVVDFGELDERRVKVAADDSVTIQLPAPTTEKPALDIEDSYVADYEQGFLNKFEDSDLERQAQLTAVKQMAKAANGNDALIDLARTNTTTMLRGLLGALGFTNVTITFDDESSTKTPQPDVR